MYLLRHGQSWFNLHFNASQRDPGIEDPELTPLGAEQARSAARRLTGAGLTRIIVSPYTRALQTAQPFIAMHRVPVHVMPEVRERKAFVCDIGSPPDVLATRFPQHDFAHLPRRWWHHGEEPEAETLTRAAAFRESMAARDDWATTLVVSHWAFILALTGESIGNGELLRYDPARSATTRTTVSR